MRMARMARMARMMRWNVARWLLRRLGKTWPPRLMLLTHL
jgi:hypothetical protein